MKGKEASEVKAPFSERHPKINFVIGLLFLLILIAGGLAALYYAIKHIGIGISILTDWLAGRNSFKA
ncbi:MAG: hypothetical protein IJF88_09335 [Oscillospiraceae bacterium]|nr:hypothetical protein [Oscillospiraceae bacterium]